MTVEAVNLNKFFGSRQALDGVSFSVDKGEAVGVLGSAGSGKSTLMRILSGFIEPTHGQVRIGGMDPRLPRTRARIGYLPEATPLPGRMRTNEYLRYRAGLKGLRGGEARTASERTIERCGLEDVRDNLIANLPQGTRQRIGLADCLLGSPEVLLLDQPLTGMDAGQIAQTRELLSRLGGVTVLFSSHNLREVERACGRLLILHRGRVVANDAPENVYERNIDERAITLEVLSAEPVRETLRAITGVRTVTVDPSPDTPGLLSVRITTPAGVDLRRELSQVCAQRGWLVTAMRLEPVNLDDIFRKLTQGR